MKLVLCIGIGIGIAMYLVFRIVWQRKTYFEVLRPYLAQYGFELVRIDIPRFYETGPFPKIAVRIGAIQTEVFGIDTTHFEYRIVTFRDANGKETTRWVRLLLNSFGAQDIIWEPGTTEIPDKRSRAIEVIQKKFRLRANGEKGQTLRSP